MKTKTLVIGATEDASRYANRAARSLLAHGHDVALLGLKPGEIAGQPIQTGQPELEDVDTVTLYVGARNQAQYAEYLKTLRPRRVIFNPGAENPALAQDLKKEGIEPLDACTLVMLSVGTY